MTGHSAAGGHWPAGSRSGCICTAPFFFAELEHQSRVGSQAQFLVMPAPFPGQHVSAYYARVGCRRLGA
eukprot:CAMPEP_0198517168 /NCGR_PEP_ID=MMETSP1462-20131121/18369_1 /TAXON_ID=1333877 /ORGANISM="Brandtodinium nutriculum, Strain RCC3387" /LENGTH=68 /DNA_ID=CAMNT_0044246719 /DNA_START=209 /DNA_END=411 /DNA_ORIENTATION=+